MAKLVLKNTSNAVADINLFCGRRQVILPSQSVELPKEETLTPALERYYSQLKFIGIELIKSKEVTPSEQEVTPSEQEVTPSEQEVTPSEQEVTPSEPVHTLDSLMKNNRGVLVEMAEGYGIQVPEGASKKEICNLILGDR